MYNYYEPSQKMLQAHAANYSDESLRAACGIFEAYLKSPQLDIDNVSAVFRTLLTIVDITEMQPYVDLMLDNVKVFHMYIGKIDFCIELSMQQVVTYKKILTPNIDQIVLVPNKTRLKREILTLIPQPYEDEKTVNVQR